MNENPANTTNSTVTLTVPARENSPYHEGDVIPANTTIHDNNGKDVVFPEDRKIIAIAANADAEGGVLMLTLEPA